MNVPSPPPKLEELAHLICNSESASAYVAPLEQELLARYGVGNMTIDLVTAVLRYFTEESSSPVEALRYLVGDRRAMTQLANEIARKNGIIEDEEEAYCDPNADMEVSIRKVLRAMNFPVVEWPSGYEGIFLIKEELREAERDIAQLTEANRTEYKHFADIGWGYLDTLLKVSLYFYGEVLGADESSNVAIAFQKARNCQGLNARLDMTRHIQGVFDKVDESSGRYLNQTEREICRWYFERDTPFEGFMDGERIVTLGEQPDKWNESLAKFCQGTWETDDDIVVDRLAWCKANVDYYRNFYAHSNRRQWIEAGIGMVQQSFKRAREIIDDLIPFCPEMIVPLEDGFDNYGRRVIRFVGETELERETRFIDVDMHRKAKRIFIDRQDQVWLHRFYFCSKAREGAFEPILVLAEMVLQNM